MINDCTILRTYKRNTGTLNLATGKSEITHSQMVTQPCNTPLFGDRKLIGICKSCAKGWEIEDNKFASETERERATYRMTGEID